MKKSVSSLLNQWIFAVSCFYLANFLVACFLVKVNMGISKVIKLYGLYTDLDWLLEQTEDFLEGCFHVFLSQMFGVRLKINWPIGIFRGTAKIEQRIQIFLTNNINLVIYLLDITAIASNLFHFTFKTATWTVFLVTSILKWTCILWWSCRSQRNPCSPVGQVPLRLWMHLIQLYLKCEKIFRFC